MPSYILSEPYKQRVDRALAQVEQMPSRGGITTIPTRFETLPRDADSVEVRLAAFARTATWRQGETAEFTLYRQDGVSFVPETKFVPNSGGGVDQVPVTATAVNVCHDFALVNPNVTGNEFGPTETMTWCIIARDGGINAAIEGPNDPPTRLATIGLTAIGDSWARGESKVVETTATGQTVEAYSVLDSHTKLDFPHGLVYTKSVDPTDPTKTANVVIGPPAIPLHEARFSEGNADEEWPRGDTKQLLVTRDDGEEVQVPVENTFFDTFKPGTAALAIGRFGTTFSVITGPKGSGEVTPGTLVSPIAPNEQWDAGSIRPVRITGTTTEVDVVNVFEELTPLDGHRGVLFAKSEKDPLGGEGTANVLIAPAPKELFEARFSQGNVDDEWATGQTKDLIVPAGGGRSEDIIVPVANKFFDTFKPGTAALAIGKIDGEFCVLTNNNRSGDVLLANRTDENEWPRGSERDVQVHGETRTISAINLTGDYEAWDAKDQQQGPNLLAVRGSGLGAAGGTQWYVVAPPPKMFDLGTWDGEWASGSEKQFYLDSNGESVQASNTLFDLPGGGSGAVVKVDGSWKLVSVQLETETATKVDGVQEMPYATPSGSVTVVTDVEVAGEVRQSAASPIDVNVIAVPANYLVVTGVNATATIQQSAANPVVISTTLQTSSVTVVSDVNISASLNTDSCAITVNKTNVTSAVSIVSGVSVDAELELDKLDVTVAVNPTYSNLSAISSVDVQVAFDVTKLFVELNKTLTTAQVQVIGATAMGKFVESTSTFTYLRFPGTVQ